ncbi:hypothetical protein [Streptomyces sp. CNS654]|uniref:hypothetical protein n=1 Tax=Streptomyces sp. CNS654 TaxID=1506995 RepID=UPI000517A9E0|nr:hypothetical protein [Streptomyces sp. CNS654]
MKRAFAAACTAASIVVGAVAGCTTDGNGPSAQDGSQRDTASTNAMGEARELTDAEQILVQRAEQLLVKKCMKSEGFRYWVGPLPTVDDLKGGGYVVTDVAWAKKHGYGSRLQEKVQEAQRNDPNHSYANALPEKDRIRYGETLEGTPSSGMLTAELPGGGTVRTPDASCQVDAKQQLYGDFATWFRAEKTATNLSGMYVPDLVDDKRFVRAVEKWSTCMAEAGHAYADPPAIREKLPGLAEGQDPDEAFAVEVDLAVAEATCATSSSLSETARTLEAEYRDRKLGPYREDIAAYQRMSLTALARAEDITDSTA